MAREQIFVSYSHRDGSWLTRLMEHLAALERWGLVHSWSDARIAVGSNWRDAIEEQLARASIAVLLLSPAFLASRFIWDEEMPRIVEHAKDGMLILPVVVRPCAWRLEDALKGIQARPADGRALSLGSEAQVDLDLTRLVYELASRIGKADAALASAEWEQLAAPIPHRSPTTDAGRATVWRGRYNGDLEMVLRIDGWPAAEFTGTITYPAYGTATRIAGKATPKSDGTVPVVFRETGYETQGSKEINFGGEYRAVIAETVIGAWFERNRLVAEFRLE